MSEIIQNDCLRIYFAYTGRPLSNLQRAFVDKNCAAAKMLRTVCNCHVARHRHGEALLELTAA